MRRAAGVPRGGAGRHLWIGRAANISRHLCGRPAVAPLPDQCQQRPGYLGSWHQIAFEVDDLDEERSAGWSVVATGQAEIVRDEGELDLLRERGLEPRPWAVGLRRTYLRLTWSAISGRAVGDIDWRTAPASSPVGGDPLRKVEP